MDAKEANRITIERIRAYIDSKEVVKLPDRSKFEVLEKLGFKTVGESYEAYIKISISQKEYDAAKDRTEIKKIILDKITI